MFKLKFRQLPAFDSNSCLFVALLGIVFILLNYLYLAVFFLPLNMASLFYMALIECSTFGLSFELTEFILEYLFTQLVVPAKHEITNYPPVAILYCTCDDLNSEALSRIAAQDYPNLHIFILDDSRRQDHQNFLDSLGMTVIRRTQRRGGKAGNLNHWLSLYANQFPYLIVLDADSILTRDFARKMIAHAEHPANFDVAFFESMIVPWNTQEPFALHQAVLARCMRRVPIRVANRFRYGFSAGHNNLIRTKALQAVGGFTEEYVAEDYATCIRLLNQNWRSITLPIDSYERTPANIKEYARRRMRHTCQTFQLTSLGIRGLSWPARLRLVKGLIFYCQPMLYLLGAILLTYLNFDHLLHHPGTPANASLKYPPAYFLFFALWCLILTLQTGGLLVRARAEHVAANRCVKAMLFETALFNATAWLIVRRVVKYLFQDRGHLEFEVTGAQDPPTFGGILKMASPVLLIYLMALVSVLMNPALSGLNLSWILPGIISPLIVYWQQERYVRQSQAELA